MPETQPDPLAVRCCACLAPPGEPCIGTTSDLPRERPHRLRPLAAASRLVRCPDCEGSGWRDKGRMPIVGTVRCPVCGAAPHDRCTEGGRVRAELHEVRRRAARAGLEECGACEAIGWVPEPDPAAPRPDVPDEVMRAFVNGAADSPPEVKANSPEWVRNGLAEALAIYEATVLPAHERQVRERVAAEILSSFGDLDSADDYDQGVMDAARKARGES